MARKICIGLIVAAALVATSSPLHAGYTFVKVADTSTPIPNSSGNFANFYTNPRVSTDGATVVFTGANASSQVGVYSYDLGGGTLARVADWTTLIPGSSYAFTSLSEPSVYNGRVGFYGRGNGGALRGIYTATTTGTGLTTIADLATAMPGGPGVYSAFDVPTLSGGNLAFYGIYAGNSWSGIYTAPATGGSITRIADFNTAMPGGTHNFNMFGRVSMAGSAVAFLGDYSSGTITDGIYSAPVSGGTASRVASDGMIAPGSSAGFTQFSAPTTDGTYVAFNASTLSTKAVTGLWRYKLDGTEGTVIADINTAIPGHGTTKFDYFWGVSMSTGVPVFNGGSNSANIFGLYADANGTLIKIVEDGDTLDGKTVQSTQIYDQGVSGNMDDIAFYATFTNGSAGIYVAEVPLAALGGMVVPEPATLSLLALGGLALMRRRRGDATAHMTLEP
jgi:hypothetical protein